MNNELAEEKKFYERFNALMGDRVLRVLVDQFGIELFRRSSVLEGFDAFLRKTKFAGERCVEIGTCNGLTAVVLARYFKKVVSIDVVPNQLKYDVARRAEVYNVEFVDVRDNAEKARMINGLVFDAAYVDGDHARDTETDFALVRGCGRVLFHEYWQTQQPVVKLVDGLKEKHPGSVVIENKWALWTG